MPYTWTDLPFFLGLPVLLAASGFFSGSETALFGLSAHQRYRLTAGGTLVGRLAGALLADPRGLLVTLMLGNMTVNVLYFVLSSALLLRLDPASVAAVWLVFGTLAPLGAIILMGEVLPKLVANTAPVRWVRATAIPLYAIHRLIAPMGVLISGWVIAPLGRLVAGTDTASELGADELGALLEMSRRRGVIAADEQQMLREVLALAQRKVRDVMVPRVDVETIDVHAPPHRLRERIEATRRSEYVAVEGGPDHPLGVIYARQFLLAQRLERNVSLRRLVRGVRFVPELARVDRLLESFRRTGTKIAIAVDEYGGTAGLVSMKGVVEQMVGDLDMDADAADAPRPATEPLGAGTWRVSGRLSVHDWAQAFGAGIVPPRVATVGGLVMARLERVPAAGDRVALGNLDLEVERMDGGRVASAILRLRDPAAAGIGGEGGTPADEREGGAA